METLLGIHAIFEAKKCGNPEIWSTIDPSDIEIRSMSNISLSAHWMVESNNYVKNFELHGCKCLGENRRTKLQGADADEAQKMTQTHITVTLHLRGS